MQRKDLAAHYVFGADRHAGSGQRSRAQLLDLGSLQSGARSEAKKGGEFHTEGTECTEVDKRRAESDLRGAHGGTEKER